MVKSLSSDEAVWSAVLNNEVVRELRDSLSSSSGSYEVLGTITDINEVNFFLKVFFFFFGDQLV